MKLRNIIAVGMLLVGLGFVSCVKQQQSKQSGIVEKYLNDTYYYRIFDVDKPIREDEGRRYVLIEDLNDPIIVCRMSCNADRLKEITKENVDKICNQNPHYITSVDAGFRDDKNKIWKKIQRGFRR